MQFKKIDRVSKNLYISEEDYLSLFHLYLKYEWLNYEPSALLELWRSCENNKAKKELLCFLIDNFFFVDENKLSEGCLEIANIIENEWKLNPEKTLIVATSDDSKPDGSQQLIHSLKNKFSDGWSYSCFSNSITEYFNKYVCSVNTNEKNRRKREFLIEKDTIVLIDDFIGTGNTIKKKDKYIRSNLNRTSTKSQIKNIRVVSLAKMKKSDAILDKLNIDYYSSFVLKKGIEDYAGHRKHIYTKLMQELERGIQINKKYSFGYEQSESLYAYGNYNIPNNVFPIFWIKKLRSGLNFRKTIFKRL